VAVRKAPISSAFFGFTFFFFFAWASWLDVFVQQNMVLALKNIDSLSGN